MNFVSTSFIAFLLVLFLLYILAPEKWRKSILLFASYLFYATWSLPFAGVILISTSVDYWMSRLIANSDALARKQFYLVFGIVFNLLILIFFKYTNFFLDTAHGLAAMAGTSLQLPESLNILLPLGISFYTFEAISYLVDVYRGKAIAPNWWNYNFYIMYFPHLISGPIIRFAELLPQFENRLKLPSRKRLANAFELILLGYIFKVFIADQAALIADPVFGEPARFSPFQTLSGVLAFTVQIYFDFMGYTHIARGVSLLFNIELPLNFNHPYLASNISNFWERWHITLSRWVRDYIYIPLGGSRGRATQTIKNLMITMLICGAWHGAGWPFILWGGYHGLLLSVYHVFKDWRKKALPPVFLEHWLYGAISVCLTFVLVMFGWVLFRATDMTSVAIIVKNLLMVPDILSAAGSILASGHLSELATLLILLLACFIGPWVVPPLQALYRPIPYWAKVQFATVIFLLGWIVTSEGLRSFIYFQF